MNSLFRNERRDLDLSSDLVREALAATRWRWPDPPEVKATEIGAVVSFVTFIDRDKTKKKRDPGRCYLRAGFEVIGETRGGLLALGIRPENLPDPSPPLGAPESLFA